MTVMEYELAVTALSLLGMVYINKMSFISTKKIHIKNKKCSIKFVSFSNGPPLAV